MSQENLRERERKRERERQRERETETDRDRQRDLDTKEILTFQELQIKCLLYFTTYMKQNNVILWTKMIAVLIDIPNPGNDIKSCEKKYSP